MSSAAGVSAADVAHTYLLLEQARWGGSPEQCPHCSALQRCYLLRPADGCSRATRTGARSARRVWKCGACRRQFSVLTGTVLHGTRLPPTVWLAAIAAVADDPTAPLSAADMVDRFGVTPESARHVAAVLAAVCAVEPAYSWLAGRRPVNAEDAPTAGRG